MAVLIYIPTLSTVVSPFLYILKNTCYLLSFDNSHFNRCEIPHSGLLYISLTTSGVKHFFMYLLAIYMSFWENVCSVPHFNEFFVIV